MGYLFLKRNKQGISTRYFNKKEKKIYQKLILKNTDPGE